MVKFSKHPLEDELAHNKEDLRWATSVEVADYRASRLKCSRIVDFGCGIGLQSFAFSKTCGHVLSIDIDASKIEKAKKNAKILGIKNVEFICGDALDKDTIAKIAEWRPYAIFLDPHRPEGEQERALRSIKPDLHEFISAYSKITSRIAIELPPQIKGVDIKGEHEYISVDGELRRLTIYIDELSESEVSAVILPGGSRLGGKPSQAKKGEVAQYLYEIDPAVVKAGLVGQVGKGAWAAIEEKHTLLSSDKLIKSDFFKSSFKVIERLSFDLQLLSQSLKQLGAGKVILRYRIEPSKYWQERNFLEQGLLGERTLYVFKSKDEALVCEVA